MTKKIITVFGATGKQGGPVVQTFLRDPKLKDEWAVRGVTRNVEGAAAKKLAAQGVDIVTVCSPPPTRPPLTLSPSKKACVKREQYDFGTSTDVGKRICEGRLR